MTITKTYEITYWVYDEKWDEYDQMSMGCGDGSIGRQKATQLYNATTLTSRVPKVDVTEYRYIDNRYDGFKVILQKEL